MLHFRVVPSFAYLEFYCSLSEECAYSKSCPWSAAILARTLAIIGSCKSEKRAADSVAITFGILFSININHGQSFPMHSLSFLLVITDAAKLP